MKYVVAYWVGFIVAGDWPDWGPDHPQRVMDATRFLGCHFWGTLAAGALAWAISKLRDRGRRIAADREPK